MPASSDGSVDHLQAMLDAAQEAIGLDQLLRCARRHMAGGGEGAQRLAGSAQAQRGIAAAEDELLGLGEELDLADAAAAQLHVVTQHLDRAAAAMGVDLALDRMDVVDRREVEVLAPDIGRHVLEEGRADRAISGHRMRLDHGGAFPVLTDALVVEFRRLHRHGKRRRSGIGAQPEIGAEDVAVGRSLRHELHQEPGAAHEMAGELLVLGQRRRVAVVEQDQVDVARIVEFAGAEFPHAEHGEGRRLRIVADAQLPVAGKLQKYGIGEGVQAARGEGTERARYAVERPGPGDIGHGHGQRHAPLQPPQGRRDRLGGGPRSRFVVGCGKLGHQPGKRRIRPMAPQIGHKIGVL